MAIDRERDERAAALIPTGHSVDERTFKDATCLLFSMGRPIQEAIDLATALVHRSSPAFVPAYKPALLLIDSQ